MPTTIEKHLNVGRALSIVEAGATLAGGAALIAFSPAVLPLALGAAAVTSGIYRAGALVRRWKDPEIYPIGSVVTTETEEAAITEAKDGLVYSEPRVLASTRESWKGQHNYSPISSVVKLAAGIAGLMLALPAASGLLAVGIGVASATMATVGFAGTVGAVFLVATPVLKHAAKAIHYKAASIANKIANKFRRKKEPAEVLEPLFQQPEKPVAVFLPVLKNSPAIAVAGIKSVFNNISPLKKDRHPLVVFSVTSSVTRKFMAAPTA